jgi:hypothetical protein
MDPAGNTKLEKRRSRGRIDPVLAVAEAARAVAAPSYEFTGLMLML